MLKYLSYILLLFLMISFDACKKDPCESTVCSNGGYCANGDCVCPEGYMGADCSKQETPSQIRVSKIVVTSFPATDDNGAGWDLTSGPDIYPVLYKNGDIIYSSPTHFPNANPSLDYTFEISPSAIIEAPNDEYAIRLFDFDDIDTDDFMGGILFTPYSSSNKFPTELNLNAGGSVTFKLTLSYSW